MTETLEDNRKFFNNSELKHRVNERIEKFQQDYLIDQIEKMELACHDRLF